MLISLSEIKILENSIRDGFIGGEFIDKLWKYDKALGVIAIDKKEISNKDFHFPEWMGEAPRANSPWTEREESLVINLYKTEHSIKYLADMTGRNESGIISRLEKHFPELKKIREDNRIRKDLEKELEILLGKAEVAISKLRAM